MYFKTFTVACPSAGLLASQVILFSNVVHYKIYMVDKRLVCTSMLISNVHSYMLVVRTPHKKSLVSQNQVSI